MLNFLFTMFILLALCGIGFIAAGIGYDLLSLKMFGSFLVTACGITLSLMHIAGI